MMSQNRQDTKDRVRGELDYDVNLRAESEIQRLSNKLNLLNEKIGDVDDLLREQLKLKIDSVNHVVSVRSARLNAAAGS